LLVDDEPSVRRSIKMLLSRDGHTVFDVENGDAALELLSGQTVDLVITDRFMLGMTGDQLVNLIRQKQPDTAIIMSTACIDEIEVLRDGYVNAVLNKPFSLESLRSTVTFAIKAKSQK